MSPAETRYRLAGLQLRVARAKLLLQLAAADHDPPASLANLLTFAKQIGDQSVADSLSAFRASQLDQLCAAQAELATPYAPRNDE
jgi:hypothetical protein